MRALWIGALCVAGALACAEIPADNPHDPAAPESVQARGSVRGRLLLPDGFGAARLEGARVLLEGGRGEARDVTPDEDGAFAFTDVVAGLYVVRPRVDGLSAPPEVVELGVGEDRDVGDIALAAAAEDDGTGVALGVAHREPSVGDEHGGIRIQARDTPFTTVTRSDGGFALVLPAGRYTLDFEAAGYEPAAVEDVEIVAGGETEPLSAVVRGRPGTIRGQLRVDPAFSRPDLFGDATVTRATTPDGESAAPAVPEPDGTFVFQDVPVGTWYVRAALPGFESVVELAVVGVAAATDLGFVDLAASQEVGTLRGTARLAGVADGGHAGIFVQVRDTPFSTETLPDGSFAIPDLPVNRYGVSFSRAGYGTAVLDTVDVVEGDNEPLEVVLTAVPGAVTGRVVLPAGFDAPGRTEEVELRRFAAADPPDAEPAAAPSHPGEDGFFLLDDVPVGRWRVEAHLDGFHAFVDEREVGPGERVDLGRVLLRPDVPVAEGEQATVVAGVAHLEDVPGETGHGAIRVEVEGSPFTAVTNDAGDFQVMVLGRETEILRFYRQGYASPPPVEVRGVQRAQTNALEAAVVLSARPGQVRGRVVLDRFGDEVLLGRASVRLYDGERALPEGPVGPEGGFVLGDVPAGAYTLRAELDAYEPVAVAVEVAVGASVDVGALLLRHTSGTPQGVQLGGRVRLEGAAEHAGTQVRVRFADRDRPFAVAVTDVDGRFEVPAADEPYTLVFEHPGYGTVNPYGPVTWDGQGFVDPDGAPIDVTMDRAPFDGRILVTFEMSPGWIGAADRVATVRLRGQEETPAPLVTAAGAAAEFGGLAAGTWVVAVERAGFDVAERLVELGPGLEAIRIEGVELRLRDLSAARLDLTGITLEPADVEGVSLVGADLAGVRLTGDFSGADLSGADLSNADLSGAVLRGARLEAARLFGARLRGVDLRDAQLRLASLLAADLSPDEDGTPSRLEGADLRFADLSFARLREARLAGREPGGPPCTPPPAPPAAGEPPDGVTRLGGARFGRADLSGAVLDGLFLGGAPEVPGTRDAKADLAQARLVGASLVRACLRGVALGLADVSGARLARADLQGANFANAVLAGADLRGADLRGAELLGAVLQQARLGCLETRFGACTCAEPVEAVDGGGACDAASDGFDPDGWAEQCGCRTRLGGAALGGASLVGTDLTGADLRGATLAGVTTGDVAVDPGAGVQYPEEQPPDCVLPEGCTWPPDEACDLDEARACRVQPTRFAGATLDGATLAGVTLNHADLSDASARGANLSDAVVSANSTLRGMDASGADLSGATLSGVDLTGMRAPNARLVRTEVVGATLVDVDWSGALVEDVVGLSRATVRALNLSGARVRLAELPGRVRGIDLRDATVDVPSLQFLPGTRLDRATLRTPPDARNDLDMVSLRGADLSGAPIRSLDRVDAMGARLTNLAPDQPRDVFAGSRLRDADLAGVDLVQPHAQGGFAAGCDLRGASLRGARLSNLKLWGLPIAGADFTGAVLTDTSLVMLEVPDGALGGARLERSEITLSDLRDAVLGAVELRDVVVERSDLRGADLRDAEWTRTVVRGSDMGGADLHGARLVGGGLDRVEATSLAGLTLEDADLLLTDVTDVDLTDLEMSGGVLNGVNVEDAGAVDGMVLNPAERFDGPNRVGLGPAGDNPDHVCGVLPVVPPDAIGVTRCLLLGNDGIEGYDRICQQVIDVCGVAEYPPNTCRPVDGPDTSCGMVAPCQRWLEGAFNDFEVYLACEDAERFCCGAAAGDHANLARSDLRALPPDTSYEGSNLSRVNLSGVSPITSSFRGVTLFGADLSDAGSDRLVVWETTAAGTDFSGFTGTLVAVDADLREADFEGADLQDADLRGSVLRTDSVDVLLAASGGANGADLRGVALANADLAGISLEQVLLDRADLSGADLSEATLGFGVQAIGAAFAGANMANASVRGSLWEADLSGATLDGARIWYSQWFCADASGASLRGATIRDFYPLGCLDLTDADLRELTVEQSAWDLWEATLTRVNLTGADLTGHVLADTELAGATLVDATLVDAVLSRANAAGADLSGAVASGLVAIDTDLSDATLAGTALDGALLLNANLARADLSNADLTGADLARADLRDADLRSAILRGARFTGANLSGATLCASAPQALRVRPGVVLDDGC